MKSDFLIALTQLASERHLPREQVLQAIEVALASAFKKDSLTAGQNISVKLNPNSGEINVYATKTVVEEVEEPKREIDVKSALKIKNDAVLGDEVAFEALPHQVSRIAAQTAKQVVLQRLREVERDLIFQEFVERTGDVISGVVEQIEMGRLVVIELGRAQAVLPPEEQIPTERYKKGQRIKVYVIGVERTSKGSEILVSRGHKNVLRRLFEIEVPEVFNGTVEIRAIAREAGSRSKVAVVSMQEGIDPVGSCIGMRGNRIQSIVNELQGEKIDVVRWDKDPRVLIANALSPSEVVHVELNDSQGTALVVVPERQLSLAIGKEGQNARLAAKLTNFRLDIKSMSEWDAIRAERQAEVEETKLGEKEAAVAVAEPQSEDGVPDLELVSAELAAGEVVEAEAATEVAEPVAQAEVQAEEVEAKPEPEEITEPVAEEALPNKLSAEEELALLALEEEEAKAAEEEEEEEEEVGEDVWKLPVLTPASGQGQIRFAEDIMGEFRGRGRREKKSKSKRGFQGQAGRGGGGGRGAPPGGAGRTAPPPGGAARTAPPPGGAARTAPPPGGAGR